MRVWFGKCDDLATNDLRRYAEFVLFSSISEFAGEIDTVVIRLNRAAKAPHGDVHSVCELDTQLADGRTLRVRRWAAWPSAAVERAAEQLRFTVGRTSHGPH